MKKRKRPLFGQNGVITAFVAMMLVPVVVFTSTMTDIARFKMFASQASMAADTYGEAVLSGYDSLLKDLYGLFSVTQDRDALEELKAYADMVGYSFNTGATDAHAPYADADYEIGYETIKGANLANNTVLMTQIGDFMKFRVVETFMNDLGELDFDAFFNTLGQMKNVNKDNEAFQKVSEIGECSLEVLEEIEQFYYNLTYLEDYPPYIKKEVSDVNSYHDKILNMIKDPLYSRYVEYLGLVNSGVDIAGAIKTVEDYNRAVASGEEPEYTPTDREYELYDKWNGYDVNAEKSYIASQLNSASAISRTVDNASYSIDISRLDGVVEALRADADTIENAVDDILAKKAQAENAIASASDSAKQRMQKEIESLDEIANLKGMFRGLAYNQELTNNKTRNTEYKQSIESVTSELDIIKDEIIAGTWILNDNSISCNVRDGLDWWDFRKDYSEFYNQLKEFHSESEKSKKQADETQRKAEKRTEDELTKISGTETSDARDIGNLAMQLDGSSGDTIPGIMEMFRGGMSFGKAAGSAVTTVMNDVILVQYDFGMFSNRVTGMEEKDGEPASTGTTTGTQDDNKEYSLTNYEKNRDNNYLYGAEIEYLIGGKSNSDNNLTYTRNFICAFRLTMNMLSTYTVESVNSAIETIASAAAAAVTAGTLGFGAAAAPLVKIAVSLALRTGVASIETVADWEELTSRGKVSLIKSTTDDLQSLDAISGFLGGGTLTASGGSNGLKLGYEDYIKVLLYLLVDQNTLLDRTSDLVALNVNLAEQRTDTLTTLNFKMGNTVTAVNSYCKAHIDMVIIPDHFLELFMENDTEGTQEKIEAIDDGYIKYSVIRGY